MKDFVSLEFLPEPIFTAAVKHFCREGEEQLIPHLVPRNSV